MKMHFSYSFIHLKKNAKGLGAAALILLLI